LLLRGVFIFFSCIFIFFFVQEKRKQYRHQGQLVYEWDQSLDEVFFRGFILRDQHCASPGINENKYMMKMKVSTEKEINNLNKKQVNIYIAPPPGVKSEHFDISITSSRVSVGLKGNVEKFLNVCPLPSSLSLGWSV